MIIVNKDDISSAVKQAKAMIKPSLLALENSLRFTAKQSRLFIRTNSGGVRFTTMIPSKCDKGKIDYLISVRLLFRWKVGLLVIRGQIGILMFH